MDEELFELAKDNDLSIEDAKEAEDLADEMGIELEEALEIWQEQ